MFDKMKRRLSAVIVLPKKKLTIIAVALAVCAIFYAVNNPSIVGASATTRQLPIFSVRRDYKVVSLTFDTDGDDEHTEALLAILEKYNIKATFFVVGQWAERYPESLAMIHAAGHEVQSHSDTHAHFSHLTPEQIAEELTAANEKIAAVTGICPTLFRAPYGEYDDNVISAVAAHGMQAVQWSVDSMDWKGISAEKIVRQVTSEVEPGGIILFHNDAPYTTESLEDIIRYLLSEGYIIAPLSEMILDGEHTITGSGRQVP